MYKRRVCELPEEELIRRIEVEHELFYYRTISEPSKVVYENSAKIKFFECIYEYFLYCENIKADYIEACLLEEQILPALYDVYLQHEELRADTWEEIEKLLDRYIESTDAKMAIAYKRRGMPVNEEE